MQQRPPVYLLREKERVSVFALAASTPHFSVEQGVLNAAWAPDGRRLAVATKGGLSVFSHQLWSTSDDFAAMPHREIILERFPNSPYGCLVRNLQWSPCGRYIVASWQQDAAAAASSSPSDDLRNVLVWDLFQVKGSSRTAGGSTVAPPQQLRPCHGCSVKQLYIGQWPVYRWRSDEAFCLTVSNRCNIIVMSRGDFELPLGSISIPGVISAEAAPPQADVDVLIFAAFAPANDATEAKLFLIKTRRPAVSGLSRQQHRVSATAESRSYESLRSEVLLEAGLGTADSVELRWNRQGTGLLCVATTAIDAAGENYGAVGDIYYLRSDGQHGCLKLNKLIAQDAVWSPTGEHFLMIEGKSPSEIYLFNEQCQRVQELPVGYRNTICWDSHGRALALGGFGNLAGDLSFWSFNVELSQLKNTEDAKMLRPAFSRSMKLVVDLRETCTVLCGWSPCSRYFFTASTHPRMRVDNVYKIFNRSGEQIEVHQIEQLYDFQWKPEPRNVFISPPVPVVQLSAIEAARKGFRYGCDIVRPKKPKRSPIGGNAALNAQPQSTVKGGRPVKTAKQRQLDGISDWRAAHKLDNETVHATNNGVETSEHLPANATTFSLKAAAACPTENNNLPFEVSPRPSYVQASPSNLPPAADGESGDTAADSLVLVPQVGARANAAFGNATGAPPAPDAAVPGAGGGSYPIHPNLTASAASSAESVAQLLKSILRPNADVRVEERSATVVPTKPLRPPTAMPSQAPFHQLQLAAQQQKSAAELAARLQQQRLVADHAVATAARIAHQQQHLSGSFAPLASADVFAPLDNSQRLFAAATPQRNVQQLELFQHLAQQFQQSDEQQQQQQRAIWQQQQPLSATASLTDDSLRALLAKLQAAQADQARLNGSRALQELATATSRVQNTDRRPTVPPLQTSHLQPLDLQLLNLLPPNSKQSPSLQPPSLQPPSFGESPTQQRPDRGVKNGSRDDLTARLRHAFLSVQQGREKMVFNKAPGVVSGRGGATVVIHSSPRLPGARQRSFPVKQPPPPPSEAREEWPSFPG